MNLYYFHFFEEPLKIDLLKELKKGKHGSKIADLFPIKPFSVVTYEAMLPKPGSIVLKHIVDSSGVDSALRAYRKFKTEYVSVLTQIDVSEGEINVLGYDLMNENRLQDAIKILQLNVTEHPDSWNVFDSLGEAYMKIGDKGNAIKYYEQSLRLNPKNQYGIDALRKLKQ
jgi:tetratricopeptide (TPR) repeat protein